MSEQTPGSAVPPGVHAARARLAELTDLPVAEHLAAYEEVHRLLQEPLASLDER